MKIFIALVGVLIFLAGLLILISPENFKKLMNNFPSTQRFLFAVVFRLILGGVILAAAANLKFTLVMQIIGVISIVAAIGILIAGRQRVDRIIDYWMNRPAFLMRVASPFAVAFGAFLIYVTL